MKTSELIQLLVDSIAENGDLDCFSSDLYEMATPIVAPGNSCPDDYNMPETFLVIRDNR